MFDIEKQYWSENKLIVGADEVGKGAFAGPVVVAAVVFPVYFEINKKIVVRDSKKMTELQRNKASEWIKENALSYTISESSNLVINEKGIVRATHMAFENSLSQIALKTNYHILIDGMPINSIENHTALTKGEDKSISIAAASIIAKVYRDNKMREFSKQQKYSHYLFEKNKGYGTKDHRDAITKHNVCDLHRTQFVKKYI